MPYSVLFIVKRGSCLNLFSLSVGCKMAKATDKKYDHLFQLLLCGDSSVGKTCLISRFADNQFRHTHINTIGEF